MEVLALMPKSSSGLVGKLKEGKFVTLAEVEVNSQTSIEKLLDKAKSLQTSVDAIIVSRDTRSSLSLNTLVPSYLIKDRLKIESIYSLDSRDKNRLSLFSDIITASQIGLNNILVSTGIHTTTGKYAKAPPVFDLDEIQMLTMIREMNEGKAFTGEEIPRCSLDVGAVAGFDSTRLEMMETLIRKKKNAGVSYLLTTPIYESEKAKIIANLSSKMGIPLIITLYPIDSMETAHWISKLYPNANPPEDFLSKIKESETASASAELRNREIRDANRNLVNMLVKELRTVKGVTGCNIVATNLDILAKST
jgi:methylenetetrahydrofolate reductase (NADPH)